MHRSSSGGASSHNSESSDTQEPDLELRLSLWLISATRKSGNSSNCNAFLYNYEYDELEKHMNKPMCLL